MEDAIVAKHGLQALWDIARSQYKKAKGFSPKIEPKISTKSVKLKATIKQAAADKILRAAGFSIKFSEILHLIK